MSDVPAAQNPSVIEVRGLTHTFRTRTGPVEAVKGIDFDVREGEICAAISAKVFRWE